MLGVRFQCTCGLGSCGDVPDYQRRDYIIKGYRLNTTGWLKCARSAFAIHNKTTNIWSHLLGFLVVLRWGVGVWRGPSLFGPPHHDYVSWRGVLLFLLYIITMNCLFWSALYHTRHCDVKKVCYEYFHMDLCGVAILVIASLAIGIVLAFRCYPIPQIAHLIEILLAAVAMIAGMALDVSDAMRAMLFAACPISGLVPAAHFVFLKTSQEVNVFAPYIFSMFFSYGLGAVIYVLRLPEKNWPGCFDYLGQIHNLWHGCVLAGMLLWLQDIQRLIAAQADIQCLAIL